MKDCNNELADAMKAGNALVLIITPKVARYKVTVEALNCPTRYRVLEGDQLDVLLREAARWFVWANSEPVVFENEDDASA